MIIIESGLTGVGIKRKFLFGNKDYPLITIKLGVFTVFKLSEDAGAHLNQTMRGLIKNDDYLITQSEAWQRRVDEEIQIIDDRIEKIYKDRNDANDRKIEDFRKKQSRYDNDLIAYRRVIENMLLNADNQHDEASVADMEAAFVAIRKGVQPQNK